MRRPPILRGRRFTAWYASALLAFTLTLSPWVSTRADEGGVPFWLSGQFASFAAVPPEPGWYLPTMFYYYNGDASGSKSFPRGDTISAGLDTQVPLLFIVPTWVPEMKILRGQPSFSVAFGGGHNETSADVSVSPVGTRTLNRSDSLWGITDLYPLVSVAWNTDVHNWMVYATGDVPVGSYDSARLANVGIGHGAVDGGGGYTYLNTKSGLEISAVAGFTYNLENGSTNYQNGVDFHLDYAISQFLSESFHVGAVGYLYYQLTGDSGSGATLGGFESKIAAIGPELGYFFKVAGRQWYANARAYYEFWAENRVQGYAVFVTLNIPLGGGKK
jgi:hypothetical protein